MEKPQHPVFRRRDIVGLIALVIVVVALVGLAIGTLLILIYHAIV